MFDYMGAFLFRSGFLPMWTMSSPKGVQKQSHGCSCQGCKATNHTGTLLNLPKHWNSPEPSEPSGSCLQNLHQHTTEPSGTFRNLPPEPTPAHAGTLRNLLEPASRTYTSKHRNSPEPSGTFRNLPPEPTPAHAGTLRNLLEPASRTYTSKRRNSPELSGTLRNLPPEPTPAHTGTLRNLPPEPAPATRTGTHRSLSGLKTPLAYAVGEKSRKYFFEKFNPKINHCWKNNENITLYQIQDPGYQIPSKMVAKNNSVQHPGDHFAPVIFLGRYKTFITTILALRH